MFKPISNLVPLITIFLSLQDNLSDDNDDDKSVVHSLAAARRPKSEFANGQNCTNHLQYPKNATEMKASCDRITDGLKCLKTNGKCLSSVARRSLNSYTSSRSRHSKRLCANVNDPKTEDFWRASDCIRSKNKKDLMVANERELISNIQMLAVNTTMKWEIRLHQACCSANSYKLKVLKDIEPECAKFKGTTEDMLNSMIGELLESACPEQGRLNEICSKLPKLALVKDWKAVSLTGAALDLIVALADNPKN